MFRLIDTAGIREHSQDIIENMGVLKSKEKIQLADIVLYLFDINESNEDEIISFIQEIKKQNNNVIAVANKIDCSDEKLLQHFKNVCKRFFLFQQKWIQGLNCSKKSYLNIVAGDSSLSENIVLTNSRHYAALKEVQASLNDIKKGIENKISGDLLSSDIRRCLYYIGEITGEISNEDMLDYIFSKFCIGK